MAYDDLGAVKRRLDQLVAAAIFWPEESSALVAARQQFLAAGLEICEPLTAQLWAHYESLVPTWAMEENRATRLVEQIPTLTSSSEVWAHVEFPYPPEILEEPGSSGKVRIPFQINLGWYPGQSHTAAFVDGRASLDS